MTTRTTGFIALFVSALGLLAAMTSAHAQTASPGNVAGVWQLDDMHSDSAADITMRLRAERRREQKAVAQPAAASSSASSSSTPSTGHGGGHGMGGGGGMGGGMGGGHRGNHKQADTSDSSDNSAPRDPAPPLIDSDSLLNVQQDAKTITVMLGETDRLDAKFDGVAHQSLNGSAMVQSEVTPDGLRVSMQFKDGTELDQVWTRSADGHQLTLSETWTTSAVSQPIIFRRSYTRLDL